MAGEVDGSQPWFAGQVAPSLSQGRDHGPQLSSVGPMPMTAMKRLSSMARLKARPDEGRPEDESFDLQQSSRVPCKRASSEAGGITKESGEKLEEMGSARNPRSRVLPTHCSFLTQIPLLLLHLLPSHDLISNKDALPLRRRISSKSREPRKRRRTLYGSGTRQFLTRAATSPKRCLSIPDRTIVVVEGVLATTSGGRSMMTGWAYPSLRLSR